MPEFGELRGHDEFDGLTDHDHTQYGRVIFIRKSANEVVNNSNVLQNDDDLFFSVGANEVWLVSLALNVNSPAANDFKFGFTFPAGAVGYVNDYYMANAGDLTTVIIWPTSGDAGGVVFILIAGGATAGTFRLQWAQDTPGLNNTTVYRRSSILAFRVA